MAPIHWGAHASGVEQIGNYFFAAQDWFNGSKVVDSAGEPLTVYHGSPDVRQVLEGGPKLSPTLLRKAGKRMKATSNVGLSCSELIISCTVLLFDYQNRVSLHLSISNPMVVDAKGSALVRHRTIRPASQGRRALTGKSSKIRWTTTTARRWVVRKDRSQRQVNVGLGRSGKVGDTTSLLSPNRYKAA